MMALNGRNFHIGAYTLAWASLAVCAAGAACSSGNQGSGSSAGTPDSGSSAGSPDSSTDSGDGGSDINTGADGGPIFVIGSPPDASDRCIGGPVGGARPVTVRTPTGYSCLPTAWPLIVLLHDYGSSGDQDEAYFNIASLADQLGFLYAHPDGTTDSSGKQFWNATDACCNVGGAAVDDSTYLHTVLGEIHSRFNSDLNRVYVFGYGNGGFMAYRLACDHATDVAAVADFGGATWADASKCPARAPVAALEIHGTNDATFAYDGGTNLGASFPSALATVDEWAALQHCPDGGGAPGAGLDLLNDDAGTDTTVLQWPKCGFAGVPINLWSIQGGTHTPMISGSSFTQTVVNFLLAQKKP